MSAAGQRRGGLFEGEREVTHGTVARLATVAILQSRMVTSLLHDTVLPALPPSGRATARLLARRVETGDLFDEVLLADLAVLADRLEALVAGGTRLKWDSVDGHVRGGHDVVRQDPGIADLAVAVDEIQRLHEAIMATLSAARAVSEAERLLAT